MGASTAPSPRPLAFDIQSSGLMGWGLEFGIWGLGLVVESLGFGVQG